MSVRRSGFIPPSPVQRKSLVAVTVNNGVTHTDSSNLTPPSLSHGSHCARCVQGAGAGQSNDGCAEVTGREVL
jgi:hypothetical protein